MRRELHGYFSHSFHRVTLSYPSLHPNRRSPPGFLNQWISLRLLRSPALWPPHRAPKQRGCLYLGPMECSAPLPLPQLMVLRWRKRTRMKTMEFLKMVETKVVSINRCVTRETFLNFIQPFRKIIDHQTFVRMEGLGWRLRFLKRNSKQTRIVQNFSGL